ACPKAATLTTRNEQYNICQSNETANQGCCSCQGTCRCSYPYDALKTFWKNA
ncbi:unnamed protein product, partial [Rotaria socialis]